MSVRKLLELNEGRRNRLYYDSRGIPTIGVGHNLRDKPLSDRAVNLIFEDDFHEHVAELERIAPWFREHDEVRQAALIDLCFNLGAPGLAKFKFTLSAFRTKNYEGAASGLENSLWYTQVGLRGPRIVAMVRTGEWPAELA